MKPSKDFLSMYCICDFIKTQDHLSISDMSQDCEYTWSKDMPGPTGKPGFPGEKGRDGSPGNMGPAGFPGEKGTYRA